MTKCARRVLMPGHAGSPIHEFELKLKHPTGHAPPLPRAVTRCQASLGLGRGVRARRCCRRVGDARAAMPPDLVRQGLLPQTIHNCTKKHKVPPTVTIICLYSQPFTSQTLTIYVTYDPVRYFLRITFTS